MHVPKQWSIDRAVKIVVATATVIFPYLATLDVATLRFGIATRVASIVEAGFKSVVGVASHQEDSRGWIHPNRPSYLHLAAHAFPVDRFDASEPIVESRHSRKRCGTLKFRDWSTF